MFLYAICDLLFIVIWFSLKDYAQKLNANDFYKKFIETKVISNSFGKQKILNIQSHLIGLLEKLEEKRKFEQMKLELNIENAKTEQMRINKEKEIELEKIKKEKEIEFLKINNERRTQPDNIKAQKDDFWLFLNVKVREIGQKLGIFFKKTYLIIFQAPLLFDLVWLLFKLCFSLGHFVIFYLFLKKQLSNIKDETFKKVIYFDRQYTYRLSENHKETFFIFIEGFFVEKFIIIIIGTIVFAIYCLMVFFKYREFLWSVGKNIYQNVPRIYNALKSNIKYYYEKKMKEK